MPCKVLITGGSRGIGAACAEVFARAGWSVVFLYRQAREEADTLCQSLRSQGLDVSCRRCDVSSRDEVFRTVKDLLKTYHRFDALVNNAGIAHIGLFTDMTEEAWDTLFAVNVKGAFSVTQAVLPAMISQGSGAIVNVASMWGEVGASCEVAYSAAKAALIGMTKALAKEVGPSGVRVNCVSPGVIGTDMNAGLTEADLASLAEDTPLGRIGSAREVAEAVFYLCSGASFITGQVLGVNGGLVI